MRDGMIKILLNILLLTFSISILADETETPIIAYWSFDKDTEKELVDSGPNKLNAILASKKGNAQILKTKGMKGQALFFKKDNPLKYIVQDKNKILNLKPPFSICVWVRPEERSKQMSIFSSKLDTANSGFSLGIGWGRVNYRWGDGEKTNIISPEINSLRKNIWTHIALVNDGEKITIFIDGEAEFEGKYEKAVPVPAKADTVIGNYPARADAYNFIGAIDELYIIGKALNKDEIYKTASKID